MKVGLHQGSALSSLQFITVMDVISKEVGRGPPHAMLCVEYLVICKTHTNKQKSSWNCGERQSRIRDSRIRDCESAPERDRTFTTVILS